MLMDETALSTFLALVLETKCRHSYLYKETFFRVFQLHDHVHVGERIHAQDWREATGI